MSFPFDAARRGFLQTGCSAALGAVALPALAAVPRFKGLHGLSFRNLHTDETLSVTYWRNGRYDGAGLMRIDHVLRDHYSGDVHPIHVRLLDLLYDLQRKLGRHGEIEVISGYRSPKTNMMLAQMTDGVARRSYHTRGMAIDIRMPGITLPKLHKTALAMRRGGVGYYPDSQFVHVDVGPVRMWG